MKIWIPAVALTAASLSAQSAQPAPGAQPLYQITVVSRTTPALNYGHRAIPTRIDFKGTVLSPSAKGEAVVSPKRGVVEVNANFRELGPPHQFGASYLTYVVWAITPQGRASNLGELILNGRNKGSMRLTTDLQAFALIVTAEPYFSVTQPSGVVVLENALRPDTIAKAEEVNAQYEFLPTKPVHVDRGASSAANTGPKVSQNEYEAIVAVYQAQSAVDLARAAGADRQASPSFNRAEELLRSANTLRSQKDNWRQVVTMARQAAQAAEDSRLLAVKRQQQELLQANRD